MPERRGGERLRKIADYLRESRESPEVRKEAKKSGEAVIPRVRKNSLDYFTKNWKGSCQTLWHMPC
jgi:hypothetical protein